MPPPPKKHLRWGRLFFAFVLLGGIVFALYYFGLRGRF